MTQTTYERVRALAQSGDPSPEPCPSDAATSERTPAVSNQEVRVIVQGRDGEGSTGHVRVVVETLEGVIVERDTWFGRVSFLVRWEHFLRYDPPGDNEPVHNAMCEACPPETSS